MSSVGKRFSTSEPLTEHDIAERLSHAAIRVWKIMHDIRLAEGDLYADVRNSRYLFAGVLPGLADELARWGVMASTQLKEETDGL